MMNSQKGSQRNKLMVLSNRRRTMVDGVIRKTTISGFEIKTGIVRKNKLVRETKFSRKRIIIKFCVIPEGEMLLWKKLAIHREVCHHESAVEPFTDEIYTIMFCVCATISNVRRHRYIDQFYHQFINGPIIDQLVLLGFCLSNKEDFV
jgi:hypothetical protein